MAIKWIRLKDFLLRDEDKQREIQQQIVYRSLEEDIALIATNRIERAVLRVVVAYFDWQLAIRRRVLCHWYDAYPFENRPLMQGRHEESYQEGRDKGREEVTSALLKAYGN